MSVQDIIETDAKQVKPRKISPRVRHAIELLVSGECRTQKDAAEKANLTRERLCKALKEVHVITYLEQQTRVALARSQAPAAATLIRLLDQAASEHVQKDVAIHLLAIAGHKPRADTQVSVNIDVKAGFVIDISEPVKAVTDTRLTQANHITIDNDEISR